VIMGDFNEVRDISEMFGSIFNKDGAEAFNSFIVNAGLVEVALGGCSFTWCHKYAKKMNKLDRFLIFDNLMCLCHSISSTSLDRFLSDHRPIIMREAHYDYGPIPFKFFHYWFELDGFDKLVEQTWLEANVNDQNSYSKFMNKLKYLKEKIQIWARLHKESLNNRKSILKAELADLDGVIDKGEGLDADGHRRREVVRLIQEVEKVDAMEVAQKAKVKWSIEDDENSKEVSNEEIKRAVWDCGIDKAPEPDGFTFGFYRRYWDIIGNDVVDAVKWFFFAWRDPKRRAVDAGLFNGIKLDSSLQISHLFYADDAIFMGQWSQCNIDTIIRVLDVFYYASGLRINMNKINLMGISMDSNKERNYGKYFGYWYRITNHGIKVETTSVKIIMDGSTPNFKTWNILYPVYMNSKKTIAEGRIIPFSKACENPIALEIGDCCGHLKIPFAIEIDKAYPRDYMQVGRVRVNLKRPDGTLNNPLIANNNGFLLRKQPWLKYYVEHAAEKQLMLRIAELVPRHPGRVKKQEAAASTSNAAAAPSKSGKCGRKKR
nr:signal recognition particle 19 kDa protein-like [Tanacetum cinerariifolium]